MALRSKANCFHPENPLPGLIAIFPPGIRSKKIEKR
jgi:hypothetical protein